MKYNKGNTELLFVLIAVAIISLSIVNYQKKISVTTPGQDNTNMVGADKDIYGCVKSAGYSWCALRNKCLRSWEEACVLLRDYLNTTYNIDGQNYILVNGKYDKQVVPGSASVTSILIFGIPVEKDLNNDGTRDYAMFIRKSDGGSGIFYYITAAIKDPNANNDVSGTNSILLGDRIAPQTISVQDGIITANYADRAPGESMVSNPSIGVSRYFKVVGNVLIEIPKKVKGTYNTNYSCQQNGGVWFSNENSCEINRFSKGECLAEGGQFNECNSACRHDPMATVCTMQCVLTCTFR